MIRHSSLEGAIFALPELITKFKKVHYQLTIHCSEPAKQLLINPYVFCLRCFQLLLGRTKGSSLHIKAICAYGGCGLDLCLLWRFKARRGVLSRRSFAKLKTVNPNAIDYVV